MPGLMHLKISEKLMKSKSYLFVFAWIVLSITIFLTRYISVIELEVLLVLTASGFVSIQTYELAKSVYIMKRTIKDMPEVTMEEKKEELGRLISLLGKKHMEFPFVKYVITWPMHHFYQVLSVIGFVIIMTYFPTYLTETQEYIKTLSIVGPLYAAVYTPVWLTTLFILTGYIPYMKPKPKKKLLMIISFILLPILLTGLVNGWLIFINLFLRLLSYLSLNGFSILDMFYILDTWLKSDTNLMMFAIIPIELVLNYIFLQSARVEESAFFIRKRIEKKRI